MKSIRWSFIYFLFIGVCSFIERGKRDGRNVNIKVSSQEGKDLKTKILAQMYFLNSCSAMHEHWEEKALIQPLSMPIGTPWAPGSLPKPMDGGCG